MTLNDIINTCYTIGQLSGFSTQLLGPKETNGRQDRRLRCSSSLSGCVGQVFPLRHGRLGWQKLDSQNWTWEYTDHITLATHHFGIYLNRWFMFIPYCTWILESTVKQLWEISKMLVILWCHSHRRCLSMSKLFVSMQHGCIFGWMHSCNSFTAAGEQAQKGLYFYIFECCNHTKLMIIWFQHLP